MKKTRLIVLTDTVDTPKGFHISEAFGSRSEYEKFANRGSAEEVAGVAVGGRVPEAYRARPDGLRMMMVLMEHPFFALSRRTTPIEYRSKDGSISVQVDPGPQGMATIYDADAIMFLIDTLAASDPGVDREVIFKPGDYLRAVGDATSGSQYAALEKALTRLLTTKVTTTAQPDGSAGPSVTWSWLEAAERSGRNWQVTLPAWIVKGARSSAVLRVSPSYFELRGISRGIYLVARKHLGRQSSWRIGTSRLWAKLGSSDGLPQFRNKLRKLAAADELPDFHLAWEDGTDGMVTITPREIFARPIPLIVT
jgi:plasmid replication initiation protein